MRLIKLRLRNVATYDKAEIDFGGLEYPVFVSGRCGTGKTTLFVDAVTAALYGTAYGVDRLDGTPAYKVLMSVDKPRAEIELVFEVEGRKYRIVREIRKVGFSEARLYEYDGKSGLWRPLRVRDVNREIEKLVGMPAEGLLNSAIVRQGDVVNFIRLKPSERRDVLQEILNIRFEHIRDRVREKKEVISKELERVRGEITVIEGELRRRDSLIKELEKWRGEIPKLKDKVYELTKLRDELRGKVDELISRIGALESKVKELESKARILEEKRYELEELESKVREVKRRIDKYGEDKIREAYEKYRSLLRIRELEARIAELRDKLRGLEQAVKSLKEYRELKERLKELEGVDERLKEVQKVKEELRLREADLKAKIENLENNLNLLMSAEAKCPVCGSPLTPEVKVRRREYLSSKIKRLREELRNVKLKISDVEVKERKLSESISEKAGIEVLVSRLERELAGLEGVEEEFDRVKEELEKLKRERNSLVGSVLAFTSTFSLEYAEKMIMEMIKAREELDKVIEWRAKAERLRSEIKELKKELGRAEGLREELMGLMEERRRVEERLRRVEFELSEYRDRLSRAEERVKSIEESLEELKKKESRLKELKERVKRLEFDLKVYTYLYDVFAEGRFPATLLSRFVEVIEEYANDYLRMFNTDIRIELKLRQSLRGRGGVTQVIDLIAYSNNYRREIRTFSGGEQTLIGFAIRLAISRLIAELYAFRKRPKFLIIDEGFGPLDAELRDTVAYALSKLYESGEYEQLIVISHQEDLKENPVFRTLIEIDKVEGRSTVKISHQT